MKTRDWMLPLLTAGFVIGALLLNGCAVHNPEESQAMRERPDITRRIDGLNDPVIRTFIVEVTPGVQVACVHAYAALWCTRYYLEGGDW